MKFSKKFKKLYDDVIDSFSCRNYPSSDYFRDDFDMLSYLVRAFTDYRYPLSSKDFNSYTDLKVAYFTDDNQRIHLVTFYSSKSDCYFILLTYTNFKSLHTLSRFFTVKKNYFYNFDSLFTSISERNELCIAFDVMQYLVNVRILDLK